MRKLSIIRILEYYDVPQLFIAADIIGVHYLCMLYDVEADGELKVIGVATSTDRLNDFIKGHVDLLSMFREPEIEGSLYHIELNEGVVTANPLYGELEHFMLPDEGYFFDDSLNEDEEMLARSVTANKPIIRLAFETPSNRHDMDTRCLSAALLHFQSLVDNSYKKLYKKEDLVNSKLRVTTFMAASFDVEFMAEESLDIFGQSKLGETFDVINKLFTSPPDDVILILRGLKGYAANSYKNFLEVLLDNDLSINLKWVFSTLSSEVHHSKVDKEHIRMLHDAVNNRSDLGIEEVTFDGHFTAADIVSGKWAFQPSVGKVLKGESDNHELLSGVTLKDRLYKIVCEAQQSLNETTLKEKTKFTLLNLEEQ